MPGRGCSRFAARVLAVTAARRFDYLHEVASAASARRLRRGRCGAAGPGQPEGQARAAVAGARRRAGGAIGRAHRRAVGRRPARPARRPACRAGQPAPLGPRPRPDRPPRRRLPAAPRLAGRCRTGRAHRRDRPAAAGGQRGGCGRGGPGGAVAAARLRSRAGARRVGATAAGRAGAPGRPRPPGGGRPPCWRRATGWPRAEAARAGAGPRPLRRGGAADPAARAMSAGAGSRPPWPATPGPGSASPTSWAPIPRRETAALFTAILRGELAPPAPVPAPARPGVVGRGRRACQPGCGRDAGPHRPGRGRGGRRGRGHRQDHPAAGLGRPACRRRGHGAAGIVRAARPGACRWTPCSRALAALLRRLGPDAAADLLGADEALLGPLLGLAPAPRLLPVLTDGLLGPAVLYAALLRVLGRLVRQRPGRRGDRRRAPGRARAGRTGCASPSAARCRWPWCWPSGRARAGRCPRPRSSTSARSTAQAAAELVGPARVEELYQRSKGHPLFLTELAQQAAGAELPASLVESVSARCDELGPAGALLRTAAVIGPGLDLELLAAVLGRPAVELLDDAERAAARQLLAGRGRHASRSATSWCGRPWPRAATAGRAALLHRHAGRVLAGRAGTRPADGRAARAARRRRGARLPGTARRGGPGSRTVRPRGRRGTAGRLAAAAPRSGGLAGPGQGPHPPRPVRRRPGRRRARARGRARGGRRGRPRGRRVGVLLRPPVRGQATQFADDGALAAADPATRARCLAAGGRTRHAAGDLAQAELLLGEALSLASGPERVTAAAWLGVLRAHQSRADEALALLRPAASGQVGVEHTSATLHALLFTGHAHAVAGRPAQALDALAQLHRRGGAPPRAAVRRPGGQLRRLGAAQHRRGRGGARPPPRGARRRGTGRHRGGHHRRAGRPRRALPGVRRPGRRQTRLAQARELLRGDLVFGWRLDLKHQLLAARLALAQGEPQRALDTAAGLETRAAALGIPRYTSAARLLRHRAARALGLAADLAGVAADLDRIEAAVAIEAWWWTGEVAADFASQPWLDLAARRAERLARGAGGYADGMRQAAARRLDGLAAGGQLRAESGAPGVAPPGLSQPGTAAPPPPATPTRPAPRRTRPAPSPSRTGPGHRAGTAPSWRSHHGAVSMPHSSSASR